MGQPSPFALARRPPAMECPQCHAELSLKEAITIINGTGTYRKAKVRWPNGEISFVNAGDVNPNVLEVLE